MKKSLKELLTPQRAFPGIEVQIQQFQQETFKKRPLQERLRAVCHTLLEEVQKGPDGAFLLIPALDYIEQVHAKGILEGFHFTHFELWLNQFSGLSEAEHLKVRGKLAGRFVPRDTYQVLFPVGMGKKYPGTHVVTAHSSPDLDTTIASFWGWVDAFAARVGQGLHIWNLPGGHPPDQPETSFLFYALFGAQVFERLAKHRTSLSVSGMDLLTHEGVVHKLPSDSLLETHLEERPKAVVLTSDQGVYLGEWRSTDVDRVHSVVNLLNQCLRWYENQLHVQLIALFSQNNLSLSQLKQFFKRMEQTSIAKAAPALEFSTAQKEAMGTYLSKVLRVKGGIESTFGEFSEALAGRGLALFNSFESEAQKVEALFDAQGNVTSNRTALFTYLTRVITAFEQAIGGVRKYVDQLGIALEVKSQVLGLSPQHVNYRADLEEIRAKMDNHPYLTVTATDEEGALFPLGVIYSTELFKSSFGSVTLRDFSNREETKVPPYLEIISLIDHHKSQISTSSPTVAWVTDAQSSNVAVAEQSFRISKAYTTAGIGAEDLNSQLEKVQQRLRTPQDYRLLQRLLQKKLALEQRGDYFVAPEREAIEYLHCLYAILDDTDLLSKVSRADVECVAHLLNRLKTLASRQEVEVVHFDDLPHDDTFAKKAAQRLLQNDELYGLYKEVYDAKEAAVEHHLQRAFQRFSDTSSAEPSRASLSPLFADTKEQNGCCRVGQTKLFSKNYPSLRRYVAELRQLWVEGAHKVYEEHPEIDFHLHMISTIAGADELHAGKSPVYAHRDELWIWIPSTEGGFQHLKSFLSAFHASPAVKSASFEVELMRQQRELQRLLNESFASIPLRVVPAVSEKSPVAVLHYQAGSLNSRKTMISPYLPTIL